MILGLETRLSLQERAARDGVLAVRLGLASLPESVSWKHIHGAGWLAGIGFTMSLFMAGLSFTGDAHLTSAKLGILIASLWAGIIGSVILWRISKPTPIP